MFYPRRNYSNCSVIELNRTQSNLIERLGSISSIIEHNRTKKMCERVRLRSISELIQSNPIEPNRTQSKNLIFTPNTTSFLNSLF